VTFYIIEFVKGCADQCEKNWFARDILIAVPLTQVGREASNITGKCLIAL
jgi:hypothetical protein